MVNERIKELAEQANFTEQDIQDMSPGFEKFAELIVKECAEFIIDQAKYANFNGDIRSKTKHELLGELLKKHFGVEK